MLKFWINPILSIWDWVIVLPTRLFTKKLVFQNQVIIPCPMDTLTILTVSHAVSQAVAAVHCCLDKKDENSISSSR